VTGSGSSWQRVCEVFAELSDLPPDAWSPRLSERCNGDRELEDEVRSLLEAHWNAGTFLHQPAVANQNPEDETRLREGDPLGPYRLIRALGHGGMGSVWLAERYDRTFQKQVAVKVLRRGALRAGSLQRFQVERQILAGLDHPYIARLLDGGSTVQGLPYLVMEHVEGRPIDEHCADEDLGLRERLELFRKVCSAVHFAHQNLVVHRDLKPANILVTADGNPKLLDFGIAKLLNPDLTSSSASPTTSTQRLLTPEYASPEQARGGLITTASDVYSLGVLLYRLLTGALPHPPDDRPPVEVLRAVCEDDPTRPSLVGIAGSPLRTREPRPSIRPIPPRRLAGDLDHVILKALAKEPRRRYLSAEQLAEDLGRYLTGEPVLARKRTWVYRCSRFVRRHRWGVAAAALALAFAAGAVMVLGIQRARTLRAQQRAEEVSRFLVQLFEISDPLHGGRKDMTLAELLDRGAAQVEIRLADQPALKAELQRTLGEIHLRRGETDVALPLLDASLAGFRRLYGPENVEVARALTLLGHLRTERQEHGLAEQLLQRGLELRLHLLGPGHTETADSYNELGLLRQMQGRLDQAAGLYRTALDIWQARHHGTPAEVARALNNLATTLTLQGRYAQAEPLHREALRLRREVYGPGSAELSETLHNLAYLLRMLGRPSEALEMAQSSLEIRRRELGDSSLRTAHSLANVAGIHESLGELGPAEDLSRQALEIHRQHSQGASSLAVGISLYNLARVIERRGRIEEAEGLYRDALRTFEEAGVQEDHPRVARAQAGLARLLDDTRRHDEAEALARAAVESLQQTAGPEHLDTALAEVVWAGSLVHLGRATKARELLDHSRPVLEADPSPQAARGRERLKASSLAIP